MNALELVTRNGRTMEQVAETMETGRMLSRRSFLGGLGKGMVAAALVSAALPAGRALATDNGSRDGGAGEYGVELMRAWARGEISRGVAPAPNNWSLYVPVRGTAFIYPPSWSVTEITDPNYNDLFDGNPGGAFVVAPDQSAGVLMLNIDATGPMSAIDAGWMQLEQVAGKGEITQLVQEQLPYLGTVERAFVAARVGNLVCAVLAQAMPDAIGGTFLHFNLVIADGNEFDQLTAEVFLPLLLSQVTGGPGGGGGDDDDDDDDDDDA